MYYNIEWVKTSWPYGIKIQMKGKDVYIYIYAVTWAISMICNVIKCLEEIHFIECLMRVRSVY